MQAARHDLAVAFDGDALADEVQLGKQIDERQGDGITAFDAVDTEGNHFVASVKSSRMRARDSTARV